MLLSRSAVLLKIPFLLVAAISVLCTVNKKQQ